MAVSEMITAQPQLRSSHKTRLRLNHDGENGIRSVQIAGVDPAVMSEAARINAAEGAQIIDINMGCPAKKVCKKAAGSALMQNEPLVERILTSVVEAVDIPVTLKIRTGWSPEHRNAVSIARIAEQAGIQAIAIHGRTRACHFKGSAEYSTIRAVKTVVNIPVIANGDINNPAKAQAVLNESGADALMIGRAAQGNPWIFREIEYYLKNGRLGPGPDEIEVRDTLLAHVEALYCFYGETIGQRVARKHIDWYLKANIKNTVSDDNTKWRLRILTAENSAAQYHLLESFFRTSQFKGLAA